MEIYFNDALLDEQYCSFSDEANFVDAIKKISSFSRAIIEKREEYRGIQINFKADIDILKTFFDTISVKEIGMQFLNSLSKAKVKPYNIRISDDDGLSYFFFDNYQTPPLSTLIDNTSLANITERKYKYNEQSYLIINIPDSIFSSRIVLQVHRINYSKDSETEFIQIDSADNENIIKEWIDSKRSPEVYVYDESLSTSPTDNQTCLRSKVRFEETNIPLQGGRKVYKEIKTGNLWYVDNLHFGKKSHLEVFDGTGKKYIGEANIEGHINFEKGNDKNKRGRVLKV